MINTPNTHDMIREAVSILGNEATNREIKLYCDDKYGVKPISQTIYSCLGSEWSRTAESISAKELSDSKRFVRTKFSGDKDKAIRVINLIGHIG